MGEWVCDWVGEWVSREYVSCACYCLCWCSCPVAAATQIRVRFLTVITPSTHINATETHVYICCPLCRRISSPQRRRVAAGWIGRRHHGNWVGEGPAWKATASYCVRAKCMMPMHQLGTECMSVRRLSMRAPITEVAMVRTAIQK